VLLLMLLLLLQQFGGVGVVRRRSPPGNEDGYDKACFRELLVLLKGRPRGEDADDAAAGSSGAIAFSFVSSAVLSVVVVVDLFLTIVVWFFVRFTCDDGWLCPTLRIKEWLAVLSVSTSTFVLKKKIRSDLIGSQLDIYNKSSDQNGCWKGHQPTTNDHSAAQLLDSQSCQKAGSGCWVFLKPAGAAILAMMVI